MIVFLEQKIRFTNFKMFYRLNCKTFLTTLVAIVNIVLLTISECSTEMDIIPVYETEAFPIITVRPAPSAKGRKVRQSLELIKFINGQEKTAGENGASTFNFTRESTILWKARVLLEINCSSNYKTKWDSNIQFRDIEFQRNLESPNSVSTENKFKESVIISVDYGYSGYIACMSVLNPMLKSQLYIYTGDNETYPLLAGFEYVLKEDNSNSISYAVPCRTNYPINIYPEIKQKIEENYEDVDPKGILNFDPKTGFTVRIPSNSDNLNGGKTPSAYKCKLGVASKEIPVVSLPKLPMTSDLQPFKFELRQMDGQSNDKLMCSLKNNTSERGYLKNIPENHTVRLIKCDKPYDCQLLKNQKVQKNDKNVIHFCDESNSNKKHDHGDECSVDLNSPQGMAFCSFGPFTITEYFFTGLENRQKYLLSENFDLSAIILLEVQSKALYSNKSATFKCSANSFLLEIEVEFFLKFKNGTNRTVNEVDLILDHIHNPELEKDTKNLNKANMNLNDVSSKITVKEISIKLSKDIREISCRAPWFNSTTRNSAQWAESTMRIDVKDIVKPKIDRSVRNHEFNNDDSNRNIVCNASGEPTPNITWKFHSNAEKSTLRYNAVSKGKSILLFLHVTDSVQGIYTCFAFNEYGNDTFDFYVDVKGPIGMQEMAVIAVVCGGTILLLCALAVVLGVKYYNAKKKIRNLTEEEVQNFMEGSGRGGRAQRNRNTYVTLGGESKEIDGSAKALQLPFTKTITHEDLFVDHNKVLGQGEYGFVYSGLLLGEAVAIKTTKASTETAHVKALLDEIKIMAYIGNHSHIITFLGAEVTKIREKKIHVVVELSPLGSLHGFLRTFNREFIDLVNHGNGAHCMRQIDLDSNMSTLTMMDWSAQIADGMMFLEDKKVIHGDLAARNVLVFSNNILKITDFGLSRQLYGYSTYTKKQKAPLPWRWMALESLRFMEFSTQSDIWAFGMTTWEIFSLAQLPYSAYSWDLDFMQKIEKGMRVGQPHMAPTRVYEMMLKCWSNKAHERPSFQELKTFFQDHHAVIKEQAMYHDTNESRNKERAKKSVSFNGFL